MAAEVTAAMVKELREKTGARMMDCKKALDECKAEHAGAEALMTAAETWLRKKSLDKGGAMAEKAATEGLLGHKLAADGSALTVVEMTSNTDFVAKNPEFLTLLSGLLDIAEAQNLDSAEKLNAATLNGVSVAETVKALAGKIGENISIKRVVRTSGDFGYYIHHDNKQGALVEVSGITGEKAKEFAKDIAMHIVFAKPNFLTRDEVSAELVQKENEIITEKLKADPKHASKPADMLQKIAQGQIGKFYGTVVLPDQAYYRENSKLVSQVLKENGAAVKRFVRFEVGVI